MPFEAVNADGDLDVCCYIHKDTRWHPIIGFGLTTKPYRGPVAHTRFEAWLELNWEPYTRQIIPGYGNNHQSLDLVEGVPISNPVAVWDWYMDDAKNWLEQVHECMLISDALYVALMQAMPVLRGVKRKQMPKANREAILAKTNGKCVYCGTKLTLQRGQSNSYHRDHVLPVARGGTDDIGNLVPSCQRCNNSKGKTLFNDYLNRILKDDDGSSVA